ncbi:MAG: hypothetical protein JWL60_509 [Gemmatimonadetes bacterium]|jgi:uncharacterized protein (DUF1499 family)|nr:hypothetical protein [Gemmatimonadota bacterium]
MPAHRLAAPTLGLAALALLLLAASGTGYRQELWTLKTAFTLLRWGAYLGVAAGALALAGMFIARPIGRATVPFAAAFLMALLAAGLPWSWKQKAGRVPPIHDITTDTQDPPAFVDVLPLRATAKNPAAYGGDSIATKQRAGYPDIAPLRLAVPPARAFAAAREAATGMGWTMVAADSVAGRVEATATTRWFGFRDDVVIRVRPEGAGSRVDVRSVSRVGGSDVGANAERIREFARRLGARLAPI